LGDALNLANMLQMLRKCLQVWNMLMWSLPKSFIIIITWTKKIRKGKVRMGESMCIKKGLWHRKFRTLVKIKFFNNLIMFEEALGFKKIIISCYGWQKIITL
jgi:hypothetical protein